VASCAWWACKKCHAWRACKICMHGRMRGSQTTPMTMPPLQALPAGPVRGLHAAPAAAGLRTRLCRRGRGGASGLGLLGSARDAPPTQGHRTPPPWGRLLVAGGGCRALCPRIQAHTQHPAGGGGGLPGSARDAPPRGTPPASASATAWPGCPAPGVPAPGVAQRRPSAGRVRPAGPIPRVPSRVLYNIIL
jgi:hypothetical protein